MLGGKFPLIGKLLNCNKAILLHVIPLLMQEIHSTFHNILIFIVVKQCSI